MRYENAKDILPENLLKQVQKYTQGRLLYVPIENNCKNWGEVSGYRQKLMRRNQMICNKYANGKTISELADEYFLSLDSIKKIIYCKKNTQLEFSASLSSEINYVRAGMAEEWIHTYLMFGINYLNAEEYLQNEYLYFGVVKIPLRLMSLGSEYANDKEFIETQNNWFEDSEPLVVRYEKRRFFVEFQEEMFCALKKRNINAYPAIVLISNREEYKSFMKDYGRYFLVLN